MVLDHIGIAVRNIEERIGFYRALGLAVAGAEEVASQKVRVAFIPLEGTRLELLEPTAADSPIAKFVEKKGEGLHHLCFEVADIEAVMAGLAREGFTLLSDRPQAGAHGSRVCFVHPRSSGGVLIELSEPGEPRA